MLRLALISVAAFVGVRATTFIAKAASQSARPDSVGPCSSLDLTVYPELDAHFRLAQAADMIRDWQTAERHDGNNPLCVQGDFNRDGRPDFASVLLHRDPNRRGFGIFAFLQTREEIPEPSYAVWPLHSRTVDFGEEEIPRQLNPRESLLDLDDQVIEIGQGWLDLRPPGRYPGLQRCRVRTNVFVLNADRDMIDYRVSQGIKHEMLFWSFFWHNSGRFWRHAQCQAETQR